MLGRRSTGLAVALAVVLSVVVSAPIANAGSAPQSVTIDTHKQLGPFTGTWTATGALSDGGSFASVAATFGASGAPTFHTLHVVYRFTGTEGTFDIRADLQEGPTAENPDIWYSEGTWSVVAGTGAYASLRGQGRVTGFVDQTDPNYQYADRVYAGEAHLN